MWKLGLLACALAVMSFVTVERSYTKKERIVVPRSEVSLDQTRIIARIEPVAAKLRIPEWDGMDRPTAFDAHAHVAALHIRSTSERRVPVTAINATANGTDTDNSGLWKVTAERLAVRSGPSSHYKALAELLRGDWIVVTNVSDGDWLWVHSQDRTIAGYVAASLIEPLPNAME
ncbi:MAG: SH3 domain-containing protein [Albidovulum sp.]